MAPAIAQTWAALLALQLDGAAHTSSVAETVTATQTATVSAEPPPRPAATGTLIGRVLERGTRRPLADAQIDVLGQVAFTDAKGNFELPGIPAGPQPVHISVFEHDAINVTVNIVARRTTEIHVFLQKQRASPYEVRVVGRAKTKEPTVYQVDLGELTVMAGTGGDALKVVQNFPGTSRTALGLGGLIVRGSPAKDTKVFLDGHPIPVLFHLGGLTSVVNADTLESIDFVPGNFGARYGRATGGVVALETRSGKAAPHGYMDVDLLDVTFLAEASLAGGGILVSGRRSWVDTFFDLIFSGLGDDLKIAPRTYDYQARYEHALLGGQLGLFLYGADDRFAYVVGNTQNRDRPTFDLHTAFHRLQLEWAKDLGDGWRTRVSTAGGISTDRLAVGDAYRSDRGELEGSLRADLRWRTGSVFTLEGGLDLRFGRLEYERVGPPPEGPDSVLVDPTPVPEFSNATGFNDGGSTAGNVLSRTERDDVAPAAWLEGSIDLDFLRIVPGVRADWHGLSRRATVDPRLAAFVHAGKETTLKAAAGLYSAPPQIQLLAPVFGNPDLPPERALHTSAGIDRALPLDLRASAEVFYKQLSALPVLTPDGGYAGTGGGHAMGLELMVRRRAQVGLSGWIAYTLSRSEREVRADRPGALFAFDQTHVLTLVASYRTENDWTFGVRVRYASGNPYTPVESRVYVADQGRYAPIYGDAPSERLPAFVQLDARIDKEWVFRDVIATAFVDVQNATNRTNPEGFQYNFNYTQRTPLGGLPILPTVGVRLQF